MLQTTIPRPTKRKSPVAATPTANDSAVRHRTSRFTTTFVLGLVGSLLLWAAFPPFDLPVLAWVAPLPWLYLVQIPRLSGRKHYVALWLAGCVHWLLMLQGIRLAHPALYAGWIALAAYLGIYLPAFVGLTRIAVHRLGISFVITAPVVWVGLELLRGHLITGFSLGLLAHTQAEFPLLIQISDLAGGYTLSFVIMLVAACLARLTPLRFLPSDLRPATPEPRLPTSWWPAAAATAALGATLLYGSWRLNQVPPGTTRPAVRIALIQGALDTVFEDSPGRAQTTLNHYAALTAQAVEKHRDLDLIVWPESMFPVAERLIDESPLQITEELPVWLGEAQNEFRMLLAAEASRASSSAEPPHPGPALLVGTTTLIYDSARPRVYNSALLADRHGRVLERYYKTHPVMFGEYIPFAEALPWLYTISPMTGGLSIGSGPQPFDVAGLKMSPSICFESTIPHLIRSHVTQLARQGTPADVLVNVTNDGWFWGSAILDLHFRCGIFRAVENRKPLLVAANTGISAWIDGSGVVRAQGPRRKTDVLLAEVQPDGRRSAYHTLGDIPAALCAAACIGLACVGIRFGRRSSLSPSGRS